MRDLKKTVRNITLCIAIIGLLTGSASPMAFSQPTKLSQTTKVVPQEKLVTESTLSYTIRFSLQDLSFEKKLGYDLVAMNNCANLDQLGNPLLPVKHLMVALPSGMRATAIRVSSVQEQPVPGTYFLLPAQRPQPLGGTPNLSPIALRNRATYASFLPFPPQLISLGSQTDLAGQGMVPVTIFPLHCLPAQNKLSLAR